MKVRLTQEAEADLERIGDWIARDNPRRALGFVRELRESCLGLGDSPWAFPVVPRYVGHAVRRRVPGNYLIFYRVEATHVSVLHVLHGAMDYATVVFPEADA